MNEYTLRLQAEKIERLVLQHKAAVEQFARQQGEQKTGVTQTDVIPPAVLAAEKALNSNSSFLMRSRIEPLVDAIKTLVEKRNAILPADGSQSEESLRLRAILVRWNELCQALSDRAEALESAAAEKIKNREALRLWHAERKENAEATRQCAIDRAKCLASRKETQ